MTPTDFDDFIVWVTLPVIILRERAGEDAYSLIRSIVAERAVTTEQWREVLRLLKESRATDLQPPGRHHRRPTDLRLLAPAVVAWTVSAAALGLTPRGHAVVAAVAAVFGMLVVAVLRRRDRVSAVRWGLAGNIVWAWVLTIPCSAFMAGLAWWIARTILSH